jgi:hypothetical protein
MKGMNAPARVLVKKPMPKALSNGSFKTLHKNLDDK